MNVLRTSSFLLAGLAIYLASPVLALRDGPYAICNDDVCANIAKDPSPRLVAGPPADRPTVWWIATIPGTGDMYTITEFRDDDKIPSQWTYEANPDTPVTLTNNIGGNESGGSTNFRFSEDTDTSPSKIIIFTNSRIGAVDAVTPSGDKLLSKSYPVVPDVDIYSWKFISLD
jgi:hypothetical protein